MRDEMSPAEFRRAMQRTVEYLPPSQRGDFMKIMQEYRACSTQPVTGAAATRASVPAGMAAASGAGERAAVPSSSTGRGDPFGGLLTGLMGGGAGSTRDIGIGDIFEDVSKNGLRAVNEAR